MSDDMTPEVVATLEDDTGDRAVDILRHDDGHYTFVEIARDPDETVGWHRVTEDDPKRYPSEYAAYSAALKQTPWLLD